MIYLTIADNTQQLYIPHDGWALDGSEDYTLTATSTTDITSVNFDVQSATISGDFILLVVNVPSGIFAGEWQYDLTIDDDTTLTGLMLAEGSASTTTQYEVDNTYKQYGE